MLLRGDKDGSCSRIAENVGCLLRSESCVDRHHDRAQQHAGKVGDYPFVPVLAENRNPISAGDAPGAERFYHATYFRRKLFRGDWLPSTRRLPQHGLRLFAAGNDEKNIVEGLEAHAARVS